MRRPLVLLIALAACRTHPKARDDAGVAPPSDAERIPDAGVGAVLDDPQFHVRPTEASVTITPAHAATGTPAHATVTVVPGPGFHLSTEYRTKLDLGAAAQVAVTDHREQRLSFDITATPKAAGEQHLDGFLHVGICESTSCRPRKQPVSIPVIGE